MADDRVHRPLHYRDTTGALEVIDIIEFFSLNFHRGNILKYVLRAGKKAEEGYGDRDKMIEDLNKARWYLDREIERIKKMD